MSSFYMDGAALLRVTPGKVYLNIWMSPAFALFSLINGGTGNPIKRQRATPLQQFARDVFAVADHAKVKKLVVVAFSMSAKWAQWMACTEPGRVTGQILIAPAPATELPITEDMLQDWLKCSQDGGASGPASFTASPKKSSPCTFSKNTLKMFPLPRDLPWPERFTCVTANSTTRLKALETPTLVIGGIHDPDVFSAISARTGHHTTSPKARLVLIDAGHEIPLEAPQQMVGLLEAFLAGLRE